MDSHVGVKYTVVADLIDAVSGQWDRSLLWSVFHPLHAEAITNSHLSVDMRQDQLIWIPEKSGKFSVKSCFREELKHKVIPNSPVRNTWWQKLWKLKVNERLKLGLWKLLWDVIPTKKKIAARVGRREIEEVRCVLCGGEEETISHLLVGCWVSRIIWSKFPWAMDVRAFQ